MEAIRAQRKFPDSPDIQVLLGLAGYYNTQLPMTKLAVRNLQEAQPDSKWAPMLEGLQDRWKAAHQMPCGPLRRRPGAVCRMRTCCWESCCAKQETTPAAEREYREAERLNPRDGQVGLELGKAAAGARRFDWGAHSSGARHRVHARRSRRTLSTGDSLRPPGPKGKAEEQLRLSRQLTKEQAEASR